MRMAVGWAAVATSVFWVATACASAELTDGPVPHSVLLQMRAGGNGEGPKRIDMAGRASTFVDRVSKSPLSFQHRVRVEDPAVGYFDGGPVPAGMVFVVREVSYLGSSFGDDFGDGEFWLSVGGEDVVRVHNGPLLSRGRWRGEVEIHPGQEDQVFLAVANSSTGTAAVMGELVAASSLPHR